MRITKWMMAATLIAGTLWFGGCKEEDELKVSTDPTEDNVCEEAAEVVCHNAFQCCVGEELETYFGVEITTTEKECRRDVALKCRQKYSTVFYSLAQQRVSLNLAQVKQCLTMSLAPDDVCFPYKAVNDKQTEACDSVTEDMIQGLVAIGGACEFDYECAGEAICTEARTCKSLLAAGQPCTGDFQCIAALHCGLNDDFESVCRTDGTAGAACAADNECAEGLYCNMIGVGVGPDVEADDVDSDTTITVPRPGTCAAPKANGAACGVNYVSDSTTGNYTSDKECVSGNCLPGICADGRGDCETNADCMGACSESTVPCMYDEDCGKACSGGLYDGSYCDEASDCSGTCSLTGSTCVDATDCLSVCVTPEGASLNLTCTTTAECVSSYGDGYTCSVPTCENAGSCVAAETCNDVSSCVGRTCAGEYYVQNYCYMGWNWFDMPSSGK